MSVSILVLMARCFDILILLVWGKTFLKSLILGEKYKPITPPFIVYLLTSSLRPAMKSLCVIVQVALDQIAENNQG